MLVASGPPRWPQATIVSSPERLGFRTHTSIDRSLLPVTSAGAIGPRYPSFGSNWTNCVPLLIVTRGDPTAANDPPRLPRLAHDAVPAVGSLPRRLTSSAPAV